MKSWLGWLTMQITVSELDVSVFYTHDGLAKITDCLAPNQPTIVLRHLGTVVFPSDVDGVQIISRAACSAHSAHR